MDTESTSLDQKIRLTDAIFERERKRWAVRRLMAITSFLVLIILVTFIVILAPIVLDTSQIEGIKSNESIIKFILGCLTTIVLGYYGLCSVDDVKSKAMIVTKSLIK